MVFEYLSAQRGTVLFSLPFVNDTDNHIVSSIFFVDKEQRIPHLGQSKNPPVPMARYKCSHGIVYRCSLKKKCKVSAFNIPALRAIMKLILGNYRNFQSQ